MFLECRQVLIQSLIDAGITRQVHTSKKRLALDYESHVGAVLFEEEAIEKDGSKRIYEKNGTRQKRRKKYSRTITFSIVIGERDIEKVENIYQNFLATLPDGIYVDGNYVCMTPSVADWLDDEDSILKAKCAAQLKVSCEGGLYQDTGYTEVRAVEVAAGKE